MILVFPTRPKKNIEKSGLPNRECSVFLKAFGPQWLTAGVGKRCVGSFDEKDLGGGLQPAVRRRSGKSGGHAG
jgi:hypothetical protein